MIERRIYLFLALLGMGAVLIVSYFQAAPGYMDAEYYLAGGLRLAGGQGFTEPFKWNFLDVITPADPYSPGSLTFPSHAYWMPLASILASLGMVLTGSLSFAAGRLGFLLAAGLIPPLSARLAVSFYTSEENPKPVHRAAILAGLLAVFPIFYLVYLPTTDTFAIYMLLGGLWFLTLGRGDEQEKSLLWRPLVLGLLSGLMHLTRADGLLWLGLSLLAAGSYTRSSTSLLLNADPIASTTLSRQKQLVISISTFFKFALLSLLGYLLVMGPWLLRNWVVFGAPLAPGGSAALWQTDYNELYIYPGTVLTPDRWWASGFVAILKARLDALGTNLQTALAVQGEIFLLPLVLLGLWHLRSDRRVRFGFLGWLLTLLVMTLIFPFAGARGGFFHSGAAFQPLWWALVPVGLDVFVTWGARVRGWQIAQASRVFSTTLVLFVIVLSGLLTFQRLNQGDPGKPGWNTSYKRYSRVESSLQSLGALPADAVMVNDPPGYYLASKRSGVAIPYGDEETLLAVAQRYRVKYLLLELDQVLESDLYAHPNSRPGLSYLGTLDKVAIFVFDEE